MYKIIEKSLSRLVKDLHNYTITKKLSLTPAEVKILISPYIISSHGKQFLLFLDGNELSATKIITTCCISTYDKQKPKAHLQPISVKTQHFILTLTTAPLIKCRFKYSTKPILRSCDITLPRITRELPCNNCRNEVKENKSIATIIADPAS